MKLRYFKYTPILFPLVALFSAGAAIVVRWIFTAKPEELAAAAAIVAMTTVASMLLSYIIFVATEKE